MMSGKDLLCLGGCGLGCDGVRDLAASLSREYTNIPLDSKSSGAVVEALMDGHPWPAVSVPRSV